MKMSFVRTLTTSKCPIFIIFNDIKGAVVKKILPREQTFLGYNLQYLPPSIPSGSAASHWHSKAEQSSYKNAGHAST